MKLEIIFVILDIAAFSSCQICGVTTVEHKSTRERPAVDGRIVGGVESKEGAWPWLVALASLLEQKKTKTVVPDFKCGGVIITDQHILTAAHCFDQDIYLVRMGSNDIVSYVEPPVDALVKSFIIHEDFDSNQAFNDIAIIVLKDKIKFGEKVQPICLPREPEFRDSQGFDHRFPFVAGWGDTLPGNDQGTARLREVQLPVVNLEKCKTIYEDFGTNVTDMNICAGYDEGGKDTCQGDSGGPLMIESEKDGKTLYYTIGIVSHGHGCAVEGVPGVFTDVIEYLDWIDMVIQNTSDLPVRKVALVTTTPPVVTPRLKRKRRRHQRPRFQRNRPVRNPEQISNNNQRIGKNSVDKESLYNVGWNFPNG